MRDVATRLLAAVALVAATPLLLPIALGVLVSLGRPLLFVQARGGLAGRPFAMVKFRSMRATADSRGVPLPDAARTTRFGAFLRRSRLDELPGLWNVAAGHMALVGPRPLLPETLAAMGERGVARGAVRPGLTGWAQVNGNSRLPEADKLALDLWYIAHATAWLDLRILLRTVAVVVAGERIHHRTIGEAHASHPHRCG